MCVCTYNIYTHTYMHTYTALDKSKFTVICLENNTIINKNNTRMNYVLHTHNSKPTLTTPCIYM